MGLPGWRVAAQITLPLARRGLLAGVALGFARALGDFGTTVMVAGNIPGRTQTMPIAVYDAVQAFDYDRAGTLAMVLLGIAVTVLLLVRRLERGIS
jgi:molybdate transport system permease protein